MEVRHNTALLEKALDIAVKNSEAPYLAARAAAEAEVNRTTALRRIAMGIAIAIAAVGIGFGIYWSKQEPTAVATAQQGEALAPNPVEKPAEKTIPAESDQKAPETVQQPLTPPQSDTAADPGIKTTDFTIFRSKVVEIGQRPWEVSAGHQFATEEDQLSGKWEAAWCYTYVQGNNLDVRINLGFRRSVSDVQSPPLYEPNLAEVASLSPEDVTKLARACPWMDGQSFDVTVGPSGANVSPQSDNLSPEVQLVGSVLFYKGAIRENFETYLRAQNFDTLSIESDGGYVDVAISAGKWLRANKKTVRTQRRCFSACVFVIAGGLARQADNTADIGVHRFRKTTGAEPDDIEKAQQKSAEILTYLSEMGIAPALWIAMATTPAETINVIEHDKLREWGLLNDGTVEIKEDPVDQIPSIQSENMLSWVNYDAAGGDFPNMPLREITEKECVDRCAKDPQCQLLTYNTKKNACFLKSGFDKVLQFKGAVIHYKETARSKLLDFARKLEE